MNIHRNMNLHDLMEHMGTEATLDDAKIMRGLLVNEGLDGHDLNELPDKEWDRLLSLVCGPWTLMDSDTAEPIREATQAEAAESFDTGTYEGHFSVTIDGEERTCYVE